MHIRIVFYYILFKETWYFILNVFISIQKDVNTYNSNLLIFRYTDYWFIELLLNY